MRNKVIHFIDHYDSFSFNLVDWLKHGGHDWHVKHYYFDTPGLANYLMSKREPCVFSPGPNDPFSAESSIEIVKNLCGQAPILGVCLGHQILAVSQGGTIVRAKNPVHGERRRLHIAADSVAFSGMVGNISAAVYNSLVVRITPTRDVSITALNDEGEIQALEVLPESLAPAIGLQFHPESFLSDQSSLLIQKNWIDVLNRWFEDTPRTRPEQNHVRRSEIADFCMPS